MHRRLLLNLAAIVAISFTFTTQAQLSAGKEPKAKVSLVSSADAVVAGRSWDVGIQFELQDGWHIYWVNSGDSGLPPSVTWTLPDGWTAGPLQFPIPKRHHSAGDIVTNILPGAPVLISNITPPTALAGDSINLTADVEYLICSKNCIRESAQIKLELPVLKPGGNAQPINESLFKRARRALPKETSKYLSVIAHATPSTLVPGQSFELALDVSIKRGYHIQSHEPLNPAFIKFDTFLKPAPHVTYDDAIYPKPKFRTLKYVGKVSEYDGRINVRIPARLGDGSTTPPAQLGGIIKYQACDAKGTCFPPDALAFAATGLTHKVGSAAPPDAAPQAAAKISTEPGDHENVGAPIGSTGVPAGVGDAGTADDQDLEGFLRSLGLPGLLLMCFFYGLLINATPCVLPLLSIKVLTFVQQAHESRGRTMMLGLSFGAGVILFFVALGLLAGQGKNILQYPVAVIALGTVVLAMSLSMLGVFTLQVPTSATKLEASIQQEGILASFGKGALAPILGFACTAPMMAGGLAWATQQPKNTAILAFFVMGMGMAFPYVVLGANPKWLNFLPKPGNWMITFERMMGFLLLGLVVLLIHPLIAHIGTEGLEWTLVFFVVVGMACWTLGKVEITMPSAQRWRYRATAGATVVIGAALIYGWVYPIDQNRGTTPTDHGPIDWREWSAEAVEESVGAGHTVFVDFTAAYCTNCKVNKKRAINTPETVQKIQSLGVIAFRADFTGGDERIFETLEQFGRPGPPLNLIYPAGQHDKPIVLDVLFSKQYLLDKLDEAGPSRARSASTLIP
jgi:thiol:disulfide interchange protein DsbD